MAKLKLITPEVATQSDKSIEAKNVAAREKARKQAKAEKKVDKKVRSHIVIDGVVVENVDHLEMSKQWCGRRLINYIGEAWPLIEPRREFKNGWVIGAVAEHLDAVSRGYIGDLLINVPPGCMKSLSTSVFWPTYEWGPMNMPNMRHINFSYSPSLTIRDNRKARNIIRSRWYQERWGQQFTMVNDQNAKIKFENDKTGWMLATSIGGVGTGERADRTKLDDPHNVQDGESDTVRQSTVQWFRETLSTRVNDITKSTFIVIMQRVHEEDVSGEIIAEEFGYTHLMIPMRYDGERHCKTIYLPNSWQCKLRATRDDPEPAWEDPRIGIELNLNHKELADQEDKAERKLAANELSYGVSAVLIGEGSLAFPELFPEDAVKKLEHRLGEYATAAQLDQLPGPRKGGMFKREKFQIIPALPAGGVFVRGWDFAGTKATGNVSQRQAASASVLLSVHHDGRIFVVDATEEFISPSELDATLVNTASQDGTEVNISMPQDPGQAGKHQVSSMSGKLAGYSFEFTPETGDKVTRAQPFASQVEVSNVFLVKGDWNKMYLDRMSMFPNGRMDITDASSRAYARALQLTTRKKSTKLTGASGLNVGGSSSGANGINGGGNITSPTISHHPRIGGGNGLGGVNSR